MIDFLLDKYIKSERFKRYLHSAIVRGGQALCAIFLARYAKRLNVDEAAFAEHFNALVGLIATGLVSVLIELYSSYRAKVAVKTVEIAASLEPGTVTPIVAREMAKAEIKAEKKDKAA